MPSPPSAVLEAFGLVDIPVALPGGQGDSWLAGGTVLKPGADPRAQEWVGTQLARVPQRGFRLAPALPARDGRWTVEGWSATGHVDGMGTEERPGDPDWAAVLAAGRALHRAMRHLPRPEWLRVRDDPWARADAAAWGEADLPVASGFQPLAARLRRALDPGTPSGTAQLVHLDLTGNVLLDPPRPPAVIDLSLAWRPPAYAEGVVLADALCWHDGRPELVERLDVPRDAVVRALLFRVLVLTPLGEGRWTHAEVEEQVWRHTHAAEQLGL